MTIAIICARGGSRRLPRKNVKEFCGLPLVAWTIIQAKTSYLVDKTFVTTDDDEIEAVSKSFGAEVIRRPDWPDANECAANRPILHAINVLLQRYGKEFDTVITILPTMPLNKPGDMDRGITLYRQYGADAISPAIVRRETCHMKKMSYNRTRCAIFDKKSQYLDGIGYAITSPEWYIDYCNMQVSDLDADLDKMENWVRTEGYWYPVEVWQYADTDTAEEFELGEVLMEHYICKGTGPQCYYDYLNQHTVQVIPYAGAGSFGNSMQLGQLGEIK